MRRRDYLGGASALQIALSLALFSISAILFASSFNAAPTAVERVVPSAMTNPSSSEKPIHLARLSRNAPRPSTSRQLSFADRVAYQYAIEEVYWRHRIWPKENPNPKPSLDEVMSPGEIERKVEDYLRNSQLLEDYWHQPLAAQQLQAEMERMAQKTRQPEVLRELFAALGNDPYVIAECLARPELSERLVTKLYARDERFHGRLKRRAEADLRTHHSVKQMKRTLPAAASRSDAGVASGKYSEIEWVRSEDESSNAIVGQAPRLPNKEIVGRPRKRSELASQKLAGEAPALQKHDALDAIRLTSSEWQENIEKLAAQFNVATALSRRVDRKSGAPRQSGAATTSAADAWAGIKTGIVSPLQEDEWRYYATAVLKKSKCRLKLATLEWRKEPFDVWKASGENQLRKPKPLASFDFTLPQISELGEQTCANPWIPTSTIGALTGRSSHTAVWTGSEMIVWGGRATGGTYLNTGGRYNPGTDSWTATRTNSAPTARYNHSAVWTGTAMIVWGGTGSTFFNTGGRYSPSTDSWTATTTTNAPTTRSSHTAVWTGSEMIVWGGAYVSGGLDQHLNTGGKYNPTTNRWTATSITFAPDGRSNHTAVWTGSYMIVWGGVNYVGPYPLSTGGIYYPDTNEWLAPPNTTNAPTGRFSHTAVWTGSEMIVWGGRDASGYLDTGGRYNPYGDSWTATSITNAPAVRTNHTAVWTGSEMIVWGGDPTNNTGGRYNPSTNSWTATTTTNAPAARSNHSAVWTGSEMIVWGGNGGSDFNTGARYCPQAVAVFACTHDPWTPTGTTNAPTGRFSHTAVWTGSEMIVWGGYSNTGGRYNPSTNSWTATTTTNAPTDRSNHSAVWTGSEMIVWGGNLDVYFNTGGRYNPSTNSWTATSTTNAPTARSSHTAIWTGSEMIVWGGTPDNYSSFNTGGRYSPGTNSWTATSTTNAPTARNSHTAIWTGGEMIVWGGRATGGTYLNTGGRYNPGANSWTATGTTNAPTGRSGHTAVWTGSEMIVWGGSGNTGGRYSPSTDSWTATTTTNAPAVRFSHTAVWTGSEMIVWGGTPDYRSSFNTGGRYSPGTNSWTATSTTNAPTARNSHTAVWTGSEMIVWGGTPAYYSSFNTGGRYCPDTDGNLYASINGTSENGGGSMFRYNLTTGVQNTFASGINQPRGLAFDGSGNLFVATNTISGNSVILKITPDGTQTHLVEIGPSGNFFLQDLKIDYQTGNIYVAAQHSNGTSTIYQVTPEPNVMVNPYASLTGRCLGLAFDHDNNLYAGDADCRKIYRFCSQGRTCQGSSCGSTDNVFVCPSGFPPRQGPAGMAFDQAGNLFVATYGLGVHQIFKFTPDGTGSSFYSGSPLTDPIGLAFDSNGNLFVAQAPSIAPGEILRFTSDGAPTVFASNVGGIGINGGGPEYLAFQPFPVVGGDHSASATVNRQFVYQIVATNYPAFYDAFTLPDGLAVDHSTGLISGRPIATTGPTPLPISVSGSNAYGTGSGNLALRVNAGSVSAPQIISSTTATGRTGYPFSFHVLTTGTTFKAELSTTSLPPGLSVDPIRFLISGTPTCSGKHSVTLTILDTTGSTSQDLQLIFTADPRVPLITRSTVSGGSDGAAPSTFLYGSDSAALIPGQFFSYTLTADASGNFSYIGTDGQPNGALPEGLAYNASTHTISGNYRGGCPGNNRLPPSSCTGTDTIPILPPRVANSQSVVTNANGTGTNPLDYFAGHSVNLRARPCEGGTFSGEYQNCSSVTVTAAPNTSYVFLNWTNENNSVVSTSETYTFPAPTTPNHTLTANFMPTTPESCQASGTMLIQASTGRTCATALMIGQEYDIIVKITNTSTTVLKTPVAATLRGTIRFTLACTDTTCATQLPGTLVFVPVGANGCMSSDPGVANCVLDPADPTGNSVLIAMTQTGVALAPGETHPIATIHMQAGIPPLSVCGVLGERADTGPNDLQTTDAQCKLISTGGAQGTTNEFLPTPTPTPAPMPTLTPPPTVCALPFEDFVNITTLAPNGWYVRNNSSPVGTTGWFQGSTATFSAQSGPADSYIAANYNNTTGTNTISNWLVTPPITLQNGAVLRFWTRTVTTPTFPDRLQVRMSTNGTSVNVGTTATDVGDFTTLLLDINPTYTTTGYPNVWTLYTITVSGVGGSVKGRIAFRYFVELGGPTGTNSDYIGIDSVDYDCNGVFATPTPIPRPTPTPTPPATVCTLPFEDFVDITTLAPNGWFMRNNSSPVGSTNWFQGNTAAFTAQSGPANSYIAANFNSTTGTNTISNWLVTPPITLQNGAVLRFWTRTVNTPAFPDRLQVRMSTNGTSLNVGTTATDVGDFTSLLLDINPTYSTTGYPNVWTLYTTTVSGVGGSVKGRIAFRYFVETGGPTGANSDYVGIDSVDYDCNGVFPCVAPPSGIVAWWPGDGNARDIIGGNDGTLQGGATFAPGMVGQAFSFNGVSAAVESGMTCVMNSLPLTLEAWVNPALRSDGADFPSNAISNDSQGDYGHGFGVNVFTTGSQMKVQYQDGFRVVPGVSFSAGQWYHVAVAYTNDNVKSYVNGQLVDNFSFPQGALDGAPFIRIGKHNDDAGWGTRRFFKGLIDEASVFSRNLSGAEIQAIYNAGSAGKCRPVPEPTPTPTPPTCINVAIYSGFTTTGGGTPYSGLVDTFAASNVLFGTNTASNWHPFGLVGFGADITGPLQVAVGGNYQFCLVSDDGSLLFIDGNLVVDNGGLHGPSIACNTVALAAGTHTFEIQFFEDGGGESGVDLVLPEGISYPCQPVVTTTDIIGGNGGILSNGPVSVSGKVGPALSFNGCNQYAVANNTVGDDFSIDFWVKTAAVSLTGSQCYQGNGLVWADVSAASGNDWTISILNNKACFHTGTPDTSVLGNTVINDGQWHFVAVTRARSSGVKKLYVDGVLQATGTTNTNILLGNPKVAIGGNLFKASHGLNGAIDEVEFFNRVLDDAEIQSIYNAGSAGKCKPTPPNPPGCATPPSDLINWWPLDDGPTFSISGSVLYCAGSARPVPYVTLSLSGSASGSASTGTSGNYTLSSVPSGGNYTVTPAGLRDLQPVTDTHPDTSDALLVQRHFASGWTLLTGCAELAAHTDSANTGNPDTGDALAIVVFFTNRFRSATNLVGQWRFIPANRSYPNLSGNQSAQNYDTYVIGDVTGTVVFPTPSAPDSPERSTKPAGHDVPQVANPAPVARVVLPEQILPIPASNEFILPVTVSNIDPAIHGQLLAFQGDLTFDSTVVNFQSPPVQRAGLTREGNSSLLANVLGSGRTKTLRVSCFSLDGGSLSGSGTLFELRMARVNNKSEPTTSLVWSPAPNNFIFIDANLQRRAPLSAPPSKLTWHRSARQR